ncbi:MAG: hypothetical protein IPL78_11170 [Chloroflexi bacterium]|nr:hypothetical protein [Chloroflexota bacterium]
MPGLNGVEITRRLLAIYPALKILDPLTSPMRIMAWYGCRHIGPGPLDILSSGPLNPELITAIRAAARGDSTSTPL